MNNIKRSEFYMMQLELCDYVVVFFLNSKQPSSILLTPLHHGYDMQYHEAWLMYA